MANRENKVKVQKYLESLNKNEPRWVAVDGFHVITGFEYGNDENSAKFLNSTGYPVKIFVNYMTGEVKLVGAFKFKD